MSIEPGQRVLVTGGGSGIGLAIVRRLVLDGFDVHYTYREAPIPEPGDRTARPQGYCCDFADRRSADAFHQTLAETAGPWFGFVHNAGVSYDALVSNMTLATARSLMDVNARTVLST